MVTFISWVYTTVSQFEALVSIPVEQYEDAVDEREDEENSEDGHDTTDNKCVLAYLDIYRVSHN